VDMALTSALPQLADQSEVPTVSRAAAAWGADLAAYEREKRGFSASFGGGGVGDSQPLVAAAMQARPQTSHIFAKEHERAFDPLLQRLRDNDAEAKRRQVEDRRRLEHINRAHDAQLLREHPCNIINHASKLESLAPGQDPVLLDCRQRRKEGKRCDPTRKLDYNVISNLPLETHHWSPPGDRPKQRERVFRQRSVPILTVRDYNLLSNQYLEGHDDKEQREQHPNLSLLESTQKFMKRCPLNPVSQQFTDPRYEERCRVAEHARHSQSERQAFEQLPDTIRTRETACYGILSHDVYDGERLKLNDAIEKDRLNKFCAYRYTYERRMREQDVKHEHAEHARRIARFAPEKFEEERNRGYDILDNNAFGPGPREKLYRQPRARPRLSPWEKVQASLDTCTPKPPPSSAPSLPADDAGFILETPAPLPPPWVGGVTPADVATPSQAPAPRLASSVSAPLLLPQAPAGFHRSLELRVADSMTSSPADQVGSGLLLRGRHDGVAPPPPIIPGNETGSVFSRPAC